MSNIRLYYRDTITSNSTFLLSKEHTHYVTNVMRLKRGSNINFFNKEGEWLSEIVILEKDRDEEKFLNKLKIVQSDESFGSPGSKEFVTIFITDFFNIFSLFKRGITFP